MITVTMHFDQYQRYSGYDISGHGDYRGDQDTYDLVCAAVSAITLTCALGLRDVVGIDGIYESKSGYMNVDIGEKSSYEAELLMKTMLQGLKQIREQYPDTLYLTNVKG